LASANPVESKYNPSKSIVENLHLPPTILSRFDIIYLILDHANMEHDQRLGKHIVSLYSQNPQSHRETRDLVDAKLLVKYISRAKLINPVISEEASRAIAAGYVAMRKINGATGKVVSATTRQLESLIRLSEAHARMRLSNSVDIEDVQEAIRLVKDAMLSYAVDPLTGKIDMDLISTGKSGTVRQRQADLKKEVKNLILEKGITSIEFGNLVAQLAERSSIVHTKRIIFYFFRALMKSGYVMWWRS
jgi:DNA replication licensing factor MCM4